MTPPATHDLVSDAVLTIFGRSKARWAGLGDEMSAVFRENPGLSPEVRRLVLVRTRELVARLRTLDFAIGSELRKLGRARQDLARWLALEVLHGRLSPRAAERRCPQVDWEAVHAVEPRIAAIENPLTRLGVRHSIPDWAAEILIETFGDEGAVACASALLESPPRTLRANLLRVGRDELLDQLQAEGFEAKPTRFAPHGINLAPVSDVLGSPSYGAGDFEAQDEASQMAVELVAPPPQAWFLDLCAGAGGKALGVAATLQGEGRILATDISSSKIGALKKRARRAGAFQVRAIVTGEHDWPPEAAEFAAEADRILVDAPCSGLGAWRRRPEMRWSLTRAEAMALPESQLELALRAARSLKANARLIYATCTFNRRENEEIVDRVLKDVPGLEIVKVVEILGRRRAEAITDPLGTFLRMAPHLHGTDGFFAAVLRRRDFP